MTIDNPTHWKEPLFDTGDKYNKILEIIAELNTPTAPPASHKTSHEDEGADEISVAGLSGLLADLQNAIAHKASHQNGGGDEISVTGLSGLLADPQTPAAHSPAAHKASHQNGGGDEISVTGLSGLLADLQNAIAHETSHRSGGADALTDVVFKSGDQTVNGVKTFGSIPVLPASDPTTGNQATRKSYVDGLVGGGFTVVRNSIPLYEHVRLADFSWVSTDEYIQNTNTGGTSATYYTYIYPTVRETLTTIEVRVYGSFNGVLGGVDSDMECTVHLDRLDDGAAWTSLANGVYTWEDGTTSTQVITISGITPATSTARQFRIRIIKTQNDGVNISTANMRIYAVNLTQ